MRDLTPEILQKGLKLPQDRAAIARAARCKPGAIRRLQTGRGMRWRVPIFRAGAMTVLWIADRHRVIVPSEEDLGWRAYHVADASKKVVTISLYGAGMAGDNRHAERIMADLGISYERAEPQPIADQWMFFGCRNIPRELPPYVTAT